VPKSKAIAKATGKATATAAAGAAGARPQCSGCGRKAMTNCEHTMCFTCCVATAEHCPAHAKKAAQLAKEDELLAAAAAYYEEQKQRRIQQQQMRDGVYVPQYNKAGQREAYKGEFKEISIKYVGDTVLIWCIRDFFSNKKWCGDVLLRQFRQARADSRKHKEDAKPEAQLYAMRRVQQRKAWKQRHAHLFTDKLAPDWATAQGTITGEVHSRPCNGLLPVPAHVAHCCCWVCQPPEEVAAAAADSDADDDADDVDEEL
jgi:LRP1 type putative zinc finger protein